MNDYCCITKMVNNVTGKAKEYPEDLENEHCSFGEFIFEPRLIKQ